MATSRSEAAWVRIFIPAACLIPLVCLPGMRDPYLIPKVFAAGACLAFAGAAAAARWGGAVPKTRADGALLALSGVFLLSTVRSADPWLSAFGPDRFPLLGLPGFAAILGAYYAGAFMGSGPARDRNRDDFIFWASALAFPVSMWALLESAGVFPMNFPPRAAGPLGHPTHLGASLAAAAPFVLYRALRGGGPVVFRLGEWLGLAALAAALAATRSRGAFLAAGAGTALTLYLSLRDPALKRRAAAAALLCALAASLFALGRQGDMLRVSDLSRVRAAGIAWQAFKDSPGLGTGPGTYSLAFRRFKSEADAGLVNLRTVLGHAHNDWLEVAATLGVLGLGAYAWAHWVLGATLLAAAGPGPAAALSGAVAALFVQAKFNSPSLPAAWVGALALGFLAGGAGRKRGWAPGAFLLGAAALWVLFCGARAAVADRLDEAGRRARLAGRPREAAARFEAALELRPEVLAYRFDLLNLLWDASSSAGPEDRGLLLRRAGSAAASGILLRPLESEMHRLLGLAERKRFEAGEDRLEAARGAFENAAALDPNYGPLLGELAATARLQGDAARADGIDAKLRRINALSIR